jgi:FkbM family methyltransferase
MKIVAFLFSKLSAISYRQYLFLKKIADKVYQPELSVCESNKLIWYKKNGDRTLRVEYGLNHSAVVYDIGGYEGDWAAEISARYACKIYVFEPVLSFVKDLEKRFGNNPMIRVFPYGLAGEDGEMLISHLAEGSSVFRDTNNLNETTEEKELIQLRAIDSIIEELNTPHIALMKINIEGGEFELLECLLKNGLHMNIENLQIQFHDFVPDALNRMNNIKSRLKETHYLTYEYVFVWENWKRKH